MKTEMKVAITMDLKGLSCPVPLVKMSKGITELEVGEVLEAVTTDPGSLFSGLGANHGE